MAKRSRIGGRPTARPRPVRAQTARTAPAQAAAPRPPSSLTEEEAARAAALEAELVAQEKAAARARAAAQAARVRRGGRDIDPALYDQPLSVRAAHEYAYVGRDIRRIAITAALMLAILAVLAILINVMAVIQL
jgi:hypothetical protein